MATMRETLYRALVAVAKQHGATSPRTLELLAEAAGTVDFEGGEPLAGTTQTAVGDGNYQIGDVAPGATVVMGKNNRVGW